MQEDSLGRRRAELKKKQEGIGLWCRISDAAKICGLEYQTVMYWQTRYGLLSHGGEWSELGRQRYYTKRDLLRLMVLRCLMRDERERVGSLVALVNEILPLEPNGKGKDKEKEFEWYVVRLGDGKVWPEDEFGDVVERLMHEEAEDQGVGLLVVSVKAAKRRLEAVIKVMKEEGELSLGDAEPGCGAVGPGLSVQVPALGQAGILPLDINLPLW